MGTAEVVHILSIYTKKSSSIALSSRTAAAASTPPPLPHRACCSGVAVPCTAAGAGEDSHKPAAHILTWVALHTFSKGLKSSGLEMEEGFYLLLKDHR